MLAQKLFDVWLVKTRTQFPALNAGQSGTAFKKFTHFNQAPSDSQLNFNKTKTRKSDSLSLWHCFVWLSGQNFSFTPSKLCFLIKSEEQPEVRLFAFNFVSHRNTPELTNFIFKINKKHKSGKATHKLSIPNYFISYYKRKTIKSNDSTSLSPSLPFSQSHSKWDTNGESRK